MRKNVLSVDVKIPWKIVGIMYVAYVLGYQRGWRESSEQ